LHRFLKSYYQRPILFDRHSVERCGFSWDSDLGEICQGAITGDITFRGNYGRPTIFSLSCSNYHTDHRRIEPSTPYRSSTRRLMLCPRYFIPWSGLLYPLEGPIPFQYKGVTARDASLDFSALAHLPDRSNFVSQDPSISTSTGR